MGVSTVAPSTASFVRTYDVPSKIAASCLLSTVLKPFVARFSAKSMTRVTAVSYQSAVCCALE